MNVYEHEIATLRKILYDYPKRYKDNLEELEELHKELVDISHVKEFVDLHMYESYKLYKAEQEILNRRREIKNENEYLKPILEMIQNNNFDHKYLNKLIGEIRNIDKNQRVRGYRMRVRKELQDLIDKRGKRMHREVERVE